MSDKAKELAEYLFTNGAGAKAERLVLAVKTGGELLDLGGWSRAAVLSRLEEFETAIRAEYEVNQEKTREQVADALYRNMETMGYSRLQVEKQRANDQERWAAEDREN